MAKEGFLTIILQNYRAHLSVCKWPSWSSWLSFPNLIYKPLNGLSIYNLVMFHEYEYYRVGKLDVEYARDPENVFIFFFFVFGSNPSALGLCWNNRY